MRARFAIVLVLVSAFAALSAPAQARAADPIIARDTLIQSIWPLDGDLVYVRGDFAKPLPEHVWMARFRGRLHVARGIPPEAGAGDIGRDAKGRKVFTFAVRSAGGGLEWFAYDLRSNSTRPLSGLPSDCAVDWVSLWRGSMAYTGQCKGDKYSTVYVRKGKQTLRVQSSPGILSIAYRGGALAVTLEDGLDNAYVEQWAANGKRCIRRIDSSFGDATNNDGWYPTGLWMLNGYVAWAMGDFNVRPDFAILAAKVARGCKAPGPTGLFSFRPETTTMRTFAVDVRRVFYADDATLRRHTLPRKPSVARPRNDDFKKAQQLSGDAPVSATGRLAHATIQGKEPLRLTKHTVWYAYRPTKSGTVYVTVPGSCRTATRYCGGSNRFGVYTGKSPSKLKLLPPTGGPYSPNYTRVDAVAGKTYWISVGTRLPEKYEPFTVRVDLTPPF
jgi:hypothetical protein